MEAVSAAARRRAAAAVPNVEPMPMMAAASATKPRPAVMPAANHVT